MLDWLSRQVEKWARPGGAEAYRLYASMAEAARQPRLYEHFGIADSLDGRFDTLVLVAVLVARRLRGAGAEGQALSQSVVDIMFADMDLSLHEIGVSENKVSKKVKIMASAYLGRMGAYGAVLDKGDDAGLAAALERNLYRGRGAESFSGGAIANGLVAFIKREAVRLEALSDADVLSGEVGVLFDASKL